MKHLAGIAAGWAAATALAASASAAGEPSVTGQSGLISMPDARIAPEGSWRTGLSHMRPYQALWSSVAIFPWLEGGFRFTRIYGVRGFAAGAFDGDYGDYKDKSFDVKLRAFPERGPWPQLALGYQDIGGGTGLFRAPYVAASKRVGEFDFTLGYGRGRLDGLFGGARWTPAWGRGFGVVAEYDAFDYPRDRFADISNAATYRKSGVLGLEYRYGWLGAQAFQAHGNLGGNVYVSVPLEQAELVPKIHEPPPYTKINPRPTEAQWHADRAHRERLARALVEQDFRDIRLGYHHGRLEATLTNTRISSMPRAVGRAARTLLSFAPLEVRELRITYTEGALPLATYTFVNVPLLQRYFNGMATREMLREYVAIAYAEPDAVREEADRAETLAAFQVALPEGLVLEREGVDFFALRGENVLGGAFALRPTLSTFFNDPGGAFRYDLSLYATYDRGIGPRRFLHGAVRMPVVEDISEVTTPSNSLLPHVRSDVALYRQRRGPRLERLAATQYFQPATRLYGVASAGVYEEMFSGAGGGLLYLPRSGGWAVELDAHWVRQRDFDGGFGHLDYDTVTAIASLHYKMAHGVTATVRGGRFLARDEGVRLEAKRRFRSGWEVGAWYTVTNGNDITSPGTPERPYHDKGIFMLWRLDTLLTRDVKAVAGFALAPWTRDVGQMVAAPGNLYAMLERPVLEMHTLDGLARFGDRDDDYHALPALGVPAERRWPDFVAEDLRAARAAAGEVDWLGTGVVAAASVLGAAALDRPTHRFAERHRDRGWLRSGVRAGNALPYVAVGLSAMFAFDESRPHLSDAGVAALQAGAAALVAATGAKYVFGRARPDAGLGPRHFEWGTREDRFHAFPSRHSAIMWAAVTPYARAYDAPWLYAAATVTNLARAGSREHWVSDTVGGALLGYAAGSLAWQARRDARLNSRAPALVVGPQSVALQWAMD